MTLDDKVKALSVLASDFEQYAKLNLKIKTKSGNIDPLLFNSAQHYVHDQLQKQLSSTGKIRALLLKGRQQGLSTYVEARFYWLTTMHFGKQAFILTHEQSATDNLFNMAKRYHDNCDKELQPSTGLANAKELHFDKLDSGYKVGTAGSRAVGRSGTIQYFHGSELAFWPNARDHFAGVVQCIADEPGTEIILETTANGIGDKFYELWIQAINGESDYLAIFIPWFWTKEYRKDVPGFTPDNDELKAQRIYGVDNQQLAWRRAKIQEIGKDLADQEYPYCWMDAFISSGRTVFDKDLVEAALKECWNPIKRMALENNRFIQRVDGELSVWEMPKPGINYAVGADVAEGLINGDFSCAIVREIKTGNMVAEWHGHIAPDLFGYILIALGKMFGGDKPAILCIENNNHGLATLIVCRDEGYPNLYIRKSLDDKGSAEKETRKLGFTTTSKSKPYIIDMMSAELREGTHGICSKSLLLEMRTYIICVNGSYNAQVGCYDDRVMAYALCSEAVRLNL